MNGLQPFLDALSTTQRVKDDLVTPPPCEASQDKPPHASHTSSDDRCKTEKCLTCGKASGLKPNEAQLRFMRDALKKESLKESVSQWILPPIQKFSSKPNLAAYLQKPLLIWHPEKQYGVSISGKKCPACKPPYTLVFKQFTGIRHCHGISQDFYACAASYRCKNPNCDVVYSAFDQDRLIKAELVPAEVFLRCPIKVFKRSAWAEDLISIMSEMAVGTSSLSTFGCIVARLRSGEYLRRRRLYEAHVKYYSSSDYVGDISFPPFPPFMQHCGGFNASLGPSESATADVFEYVVRQQEEFFKRYTAG